MAAVVNFSSQLPWQIICLKARAELALGSLPFKRSPLLLQSTINMNENGICLSRKAANKSFNNRKLKFIRSMADDFEFTFDSDLDSTFDTPSASSMIKKFYACVNEKKLKEIEDCISDDCCFEDCSLPYPIQGKKEVMRFFQQLTVGMGHNVKFIIEHVCEDKEFTAGVNWHLEWRTTPIPFTRGCSFYECSQYGRRLVIKKALVVIESPIKPGGVVLVLLKNVTAIFDDFPRAAEWFLRSPHVIVQFLLKIYSRLLAPFINPILATYMKMWNFMARCFFLALNIVLHIIKKYFG